MNNKLERTWNEKFEAGFKALSQHLPEEPEEMYRISVRAGGLRTKM
jgi:hypothetical protein